MNVPFFRQNRAALRDALLLLLGALVVTTLVYQFPTTSTLDVGSGWDEPFNQNFSFRENLPDGSTVRWSSGRGEIHFVGVGAQDGTLSLRFAAPRPRGTATIHLLANGQELSAPPPSNDFQTATVPVDRDQIGTGGDLDVTLVSDTFSQPPDSRELGLIVDSARFQGNGAPVIPSPRALVFLAALTVLAFWIARAWSGNERAAVVVGIATILSGAPALSLARVETAYFLAPLFWTTLILLPLTYLCRVAVTRLTGAMHAPVLTARTFRLLLLALSGAFLFRLLFAFGPGYIVDTQDYLVWSYKTVTYGLGTMYASINGLWISDQSPGLNYILHLMGLLYRGVFAPDFLYPGVSGDPALRGLTTNPAALADPILRALLRLPQLFSDGVTGALIFVAARKYVEEKFAWLAACAFWLNPAVLWNGTFWGQTDAIHTLLILVCFLLLVFTSRTGLGWFIFGIAALTKPQAMIFGPLLLLAAYRADSFRGVGRALLFGVLGAACMLLPVFVTGGTEGLLAYFGDTIGHHAILSANAHNVWWLAFQGNIDIPDTLPLVSGVPLSFRAFSIGLFGIVYLVTLARAWRAPLEQFFVLGALIAFAFFMLPTEIHENYGYALLPLLAVAMAQDVKWLAFYLGISVTMTLNYALHDPNLFERFGLTDPDAQWANLRWLNSAANAVVLTVWGVVLLYAPRRAHRPANLSPQRAVK